MDNFLRWYAILAKARQFKWAKIWAIVTAGLIIGLVWSIATGAWGWLFVLIVPILVTGATALESLAEAYKYVTVRQALISTFQQQKQAENSPSERPELSDESKLTLCQFYSFLYIVVYLRETGENTLHRLSGLPVNKYRQWIERLSQPDLQLVSSKQGKTTVADISFDEALQRIAEVQGQADMWDFPKQVYADERNWRKPDANVFKVNGHTVRYTSRQQKDTPLFPVYPHQLRNLVI